jgi:hypothetical protein
LISLNFAIFFGGGGGYAVLLCRLIPQEVGFGIGVSRYSSIKPNSVVHIENPLVAKATKKNLVKNEFGEFTLLEKIDSTTLDRTHLGK